MQEAPTRLEVEELQELLRVVQELLGHEKPLARQYLVELRGRLDALHAADIAYVLEALPLEERLVVWDLVKADRDGEILLEVSDEERERLRAALSYPEGSVGALMDFDHVAVRDDVTLEAVTRYLRRMDVLPDHTDQLFVVDREQALKGTLPLARLIVSDLELGVAGIVVHESVKLYPEDRAEDAANAFERYDLVSAPVVDAGGRLIGRLTVDAVVDYIRQKSAESQLAEAGLRHEEDVFAPVLDSFKNRWAWLAINLVTAFIASRVIGAFEESIARLVALAALMPIVAGIGGNSGNQ